MTLTLNCVQNRRNHEGILLPYGPGLNVPIGKYLTALRNALAKYSATSNYFKNGNYLSFGNKAFTLSPEKTSLLMAGSDDNDRRIVFK